MNPYLAREEKSNFVRLTSLIQLVEDVLEAYSNAKNVDPAFMKYLRMGKTFLEKAIIIRTEYLDRTAKDELLKQCGRLEFICVPSLEAKKEMKATLALQSTIPMEMQDFTDWYCEVIETTCKTCTREAYEECQIRRVLTKYGVYPIDASTTNKCQYSYVGTPEAETLVEVESDAVPAEKYNQAVVELTAAIERIENAEKQCGKLSIELERCNVGKADTARIEAEYRELAIKFDDLSIKVESEYLPEIERLRKRNEEMEAANAAVIAAVAAHEVAKEKMIDAMKSLLEKQDDVPAPRKEEAKPPTPIHAVERPTSASQQYRVECKCDAEYFCRMNPGRQTAGCRDCSAPVYVDLNAKGIKNPFGDGDVVLLTNRYRTESVRAMPAKQFSGKEYQEPVGL